VLDDVKYAYQIKDDGDHISYIDHDPMSLSPTEDLDTIIWLLYGLKSKMSIGSIWQYIAHYSDQPTG